MRLAHALSIVSTFVVLTLVFVLAIVPMGLCLRLLRRDLLGLRIDRARASYWEPIEPGGPASRPERPF